MAAPAIHNPPKQESKSSKKKKAKAAMTASASPTSATTPSGELPPAIDAPASANGDSDSPESDYVKNLHKSIRSVNKKLTNASKIDDIIAANRGLTLDELVAARKINADQKAQALKKPALEAQLVQIQEQIDTYKKIESDFKTRSSTEKADLEAKYTSKAEADLAKALAAAKAEAGAAMVKEQHENMLLISQFLRLAAARRSDEEIDTDSDESRALEGVLLQVYTGDETAVESMVKLINGVDEPTTSTTGEQLNTTYAAVKELAISQAQFFNLKEDASTEEQEQAEKEENHVVEEYPIQGDPTITNAGLTEMEDTILATTALTDGLHDVTAAENAAAAGIPQNSGIDEGASNEVDASHWAAKSENELDGWETVEIPRDVSETDTGITGTPAAAQAEQKPTSSSWAEETNEAAPDQVQTQKEKDDGFQEVNGRSKGGQGRGRGQGNRGGGQRGAFRGRSDIFRGGRGGRGDHRSGQGGARSSQQKPPVEA